MTVRGPLESTEAYQRREQGLLGVAPDWKRFPWWMLIIFLFALIVTYNVFTNSFYQETIVFLSVGVRNTIIITLASYALALLIGLIAAFGRISDNPVAYTLATLYVEVIRGIPLLVLLIYFALVLMPALANTEAVSGTWAEDVIFRDEIIRAIIALAIGYGAYLAEIYRAGIEAVDKGQIEAARALGLSEWKTMRLIVLPQAVRVIIPPLGNDFIAMLKDSSLVFAIGVADLTFRGRLQLTRTFRTLEVWNMVALLYLIMTLILSLLVQLTERRLNKLQGHDTNS